MKVTNFSVQQPAKNETIYQPIKSTPQAPEAQYQSSPEITRKLEELKQALAKMQGNYDSYLKSGKGRGSSAQQFMLANKQGAINNISAQLSSLQAQEEKKKTQFAEAMRFNMERAGIQGAAQDAKENIQNLTGAQYDLSSGEAELVQEPVKQNLNSTMDKWLRTRAFRR